MKWKINHREKWSKTMEKPIAVKDIMSVDVPTFTPEHNVFEVIELLLNSWKSGGSVLNKAGEIVGFISEKDCLKSDGEWIVPLVEAPYCSCP